MKFNNKPLSVNRLIVRLAEKFPVTSIRSNISLVAKKEFKRLLKRFESQLNRTLKPTVNQATACCLNSFTDFIA